MTRRRFESLERPGPHGVQQTQTTQQQPVEYCNCNERNEHAEYQLYVCPALPVSGRPVHATAELTAPTDLSSATLSRAAAVLASAGHRETAADVGNVSWIATDIATTTTDVHQRWDVGADVYRTYVWKCCRCNPLKMEFIQRSAIDPPISIDNSVIYCRSVKATSVSWWRRPHWIDRGEHPIRNAPREADRPYGGAYCRSNSDLSISAEVMKGGQEPIDTQGAQCEHAGEFITLVEHRQQLQSTHKHEKFKVF